ANALLRLTAFAMSNPPATEINTSGTAPITAASKPTTTNTTPTTKCARRAHDRSDSDPSPTMSPTSTRTRTRVAVSSACCMNARYAIVATTATATPTNPSALSSCARLRRNTSRPSIAKNHAHRTNAVIGSDNHSPNATYNVSASAIGTSATTA